MFSNFSSFITVFSFIRTHQDDGLVIMNDYVQRKPVYGWKDFRLKGSRT